ncbi:unnamed protein product [Symbiodinium natans]|uniref:Uncharacterized protein n=1 Tax=Symbiodinium natans TaxID=878477 RepID=A0A812JNQ7_9DINO|nr:unnamed protein product [Symbiodinium natans]
MDAVKRMVGYANPAPGEEGGSDEHPSCQELQTQVQASNSIVEHQKYGLGFCTVLSFANRTTSFYKALHDIAHYLPPEGKSSVEAMQMVTAQRKWMFDVGCAVGQVVGTFYQLEKNTLMELQVMWETGQGNLSVKGMKKNFRATTKNLKMLTEYRVSAQKKIEECKSFANQMVKWHGQEQKMQHAVMELLGQFGGSAQCESLLAELDKRSGELTAAQAEEMKAAEAVAELSGKREELHCKKLVYESIAANEKGSLSLLQERAAEVDRMASQKTVEAAETMNIEYMKRSWRGGRWYTDWVDNRGDVAKWRAERFKSIAKAARQDLGSQKQNLQTATEEAAAAKGEFIKVEGQLNLARETLAHAAQKTRCARQSLAELKTQCQELRDKFGGLDLQQIGSLRDHMQRFPELLGAQGMEDHGMFASMEGALKQHERLVNRMEEFLSEEDDQECSRILESLRSTICKAIDDAQFFDEQLKPLQDEIVTKMKALPPPDTDWAPCPTPAARAPQQEVAATPSDHCEAQDDWKVVTLSEEDMDTLW